VYEPSARKEKQAETGTSESIKRLQMEGLLQHEQKAMTKSNHYPATALTEKGDSSANVPHVYVVTDILSRSSSVTSCEW
jgi:hypothetical protein